MTGKAIEVVSKYWHTRPVILIRTHRASRFLTHVYFREMPTFISSDYNILGFISFGNTKKPLARLIQVAFVICIVGRNPSRLHSAEWKHEMDVHFKSHEFSSFNYTTSWAPFSALYQHRLWAARQQWWIPSVPWKRPGRLSGSPSGKPDLCGGLSAEQWTPLPVR